MNKLKSRKLIMAILAGLVGVAKVYFPEFPEDAFWGIIASLMGYVFAQGGVDMVKAKSGDVFKPGGTE